MYKVLFLHGFTSSGECEIAKTLRQELSSIAHVISPDLALNPYNALEQIRGILKDEEIDLIVGSSCGAYYALFVSAETKAPEVLVNPQRTMVQFLRERIGSHKYKSPRQDNVDYFTIDDQLIEEFATLGEPKVSPQIQQRIYVFLGEDDPLRSSRKEDFSNKTFFKGSHTMTAEQVRKYLAPQCRQILLSLPKDEGSQNNDSPHANTQKDDNQNEIRNKDGVVLRSILLKDYIIECRNPEYFITFCQQCRNFGKSWACPPLKDEEVEPYMGYKWATLIANRIVPEDPKTKITEASMIMKPTRLITEKILLGAEKVFNGRSFAFAGTCLYCPEGTCTRLQNQPCRHPELVRPSLEAVGFDITKTSEILGVELLWSKDEYVPSYLTLVSGFFHQDDPQNVQEYIRQQFNMA